MSPHFSAALGNALERAQRIAQDQEIDTGQQSDTGGKQASLEEIGGLGSVVGGSVDDLPAGGLFGGGFL